MTNFYHASKSTGRKGTAARHSDYINRTLKVERGEPTDLIATFAGNMPAGATPKRFWTTADKRLRYNGVAYRSWNVAFPRAFSHSQNKDLLIDLGMHLAGSRPFEACLHCPSAALEGGPQPHGHFTIYDCQPDGIPRELDAFFGRYNPKDPAKGGVRKGSAPTRGAYRQELCRERALCAEVINRHLELNGFSERVDHRSNEAQGITTEPGKHLGRSGVVKELARRKQN